MNCIYIQQSSWILNGYILPTVYLGGFQRLIRDSGQVHDEVEKG